MNRAFLALLGISLLIGCAGPNPNPGERTTDMAWYSRDYAVAFETAEPKAEAGEPWAQLRLGIFYENGWGTHKDLELAERWYRKAAAHEASGAWANGQLAGATGKSGYFNQNSDALLAQFNLAQLLYREGGDLDEAHGLISNVIEKSEGSSVFFCCEFDGGRYFTPEQFKQLKQKIEAKQVEG